MVLAFDGSASALAFYLALNFAFGRGVGLANLQNPGMAIVYSLIFGVIATAAAYSAGLHKAIWRYTSLPDFINILRVATLTMAVFLPLVFVLARADSIPRSSPFIAWFLMVALVGGPRVLARLWTDKQTPRPLSFSFRGAAPSAIPVLLVGKTTRMESFLREVRRHADFPYRIVGILTDDIGSHGQVVHGVPVLGCADDICDALNFLRQRKILPQRLVIADDKATEATITRMLDLAAQHGLTLGRLPRLMDLLDRGVTGEVGHIAPIAIGDLLGRPQNALDKTAVRKLIAGQRVLVTGAGGSIGSELVRQISALQPSEIILLENCEFNIYSIDKELEESYPQVPRTTALCDVRDRRSVEKWFRYCRPDIVFHTAALKHVPLVEHHPIEGVRTNILGTQNVADACLRHAVSTMVLISTDKAVNPHNVMGATKRCAESYCQAMDAISTSTRFVAVRFGNVLGSAGSVVPLFQRQLAAGGPITVTHPEISRFFMTIPEAVSLVLQASSQGASATSKRGHVYVLDMGEPIRIADLARQMIRLSGKDPDHDIKIVYTGLRPGEKLFEEITHAEEELTSTLVDGVMTVSPRTSDLAILRHQFEEISRTVEELDEEKCLRLLNAAVPEYVKVRSGNPSAPKLTQILAGE